MLNPPPAESRWRRKKDGRVDIAKGCANHRDLLLYSPDTNRSWWIALQGFYRKYEPESE